MIEILRNRRSIRKFKGTQISTDTKELLKEAVLRSPSSRNINPWEFIFVDDSELIAKLAQSKLHGSAFLKNAPFCIVVCGDETKSDVWVEDCSIASTIIQLTSISIGLGSCWIQIRNRNHSDEKTSENYIKELLSIPSYLKVESIIAIGYPDEEKEAHSMDSLDYSKIKMNKYIQFAQ